MMLGRAKPRLRLSTAALRLSSDSITNGAARIGLGSCMVNHIIDHMHPTAGQGARLSRLTQIAFYSTPIMPNVDLSSMPVPPKTTAVHIRSHAHSSTVDPPPPNKASDSPKAALRFESPAWLAMASGNRSHRHARTPVIDLTQIKGRDSKDESVNATNLLKAVVDEVDPHTEILHIVGDTPTNAEWEILAHHFTNVRFLKVATGWDEAWNDDKFPLNWPLEQLVIADAVAERITTPAIMEGRIQRLVLLFTAALRFEGPDSKELMKNAEQLDMVYPPTKEEDPEPQPDLEPSGTPPSLAEGAMPSGVSLPGPGAETSKAPTTEPGPDSQGVKVYSLPYEWHKWFYNHYKGKQPTFSPDPGSSPPSAMRHLQILGNDALQMLSYMALAKFHLLASLSSLTIFSPGSHDMQHIAPHTPPLFLSLLHNLKSLKLTLGSAMYATLLDQVYVTEDDNDEQQQQAFLHVFLPPDLETLHFRGPVTMAAHLDEFAAAFAQHDTFLPRLRRISVVLDLPDKASDSPREASLEQLRVAHRACRRLLDAAVRERGAVAEGFAEPWVEEHGGLFWEVDDRWGVLDEMAAPGRVHCFPVVR